MSRNLRKRLATTILDGGIQFTLLDRGRLIDVIRRHRLRILVRALALAALFQLEFFPTSGMRDTAVAGRRRIADDLHRSVALKVDPAAVFFDAIRVWIDVHTGPHIARRKAHAHLVCLARMRIRRMRQRRPEDDELAGFHLHRHCGCLVWLPVLVDLQSR